MRAREKKCASRNSPETSVFCPSCAQSPGKLPAFQAANLTAALLSRPSVDELADQGILRAPMELTREKLCHKLEARPEPAAVKGIRKSPIEARKEQLARRSLSGSLAGAIDRRPTLDSLKARGIALDVME